MRRFITVHYASLAALALTACATTHQPEPVVRVVTVDRPVAVQCVPEDLPAPPTYPATREALAAAVEPGDLILLLTRELVMRRARESQAEAVIDACRRAGNAP